MPSTSAIFPYQQRLAERNAIDLAISTIPKKGK
jgi:hypothetical protein